MVINQSYFLEQFYVYRKIEQKVWSSCLLRPFLPQFPIIDILHYRGTFVTIDGPILIQHYWINFLVDIRAHSAVDSLGFDKCTAYIRHYSSTQNSVTTLRIPHASSSRHSLPLAR